MRVALFIDGKNFYSGWRDAAEGRKIDFNRLAEWLVKEVGGDRLAAAHYYTGVEDEENQLAETQGKLSKFLGFIKQQRGFFVHVFRRKSYRIVCAHCQGETKFTKEKEVDTSMVADMVRMAAVNGYDIAILLSGDADYIPAIESIAQLGKQAWVASWNGSGLAGRSRDAAFDHINLVDGLSYFQSKPDVQDPIPAMEEALDNNRSHNNGHTNNEEEIFVSELTKAEEHFGKVKDGGSSRGYVGLGYFLTKWRSSVLTPSADARRTLLDRLVAKGRVIVYEAQDNYQGIRVNREWVDDGESVEDFEDDGEDEPYGSDMDRLQT